jgi:branched-chain amino acid transport system ATP-binding protein
VYAALGNIKSEISFLLVEQNAALALDLCDRGYVLMSGRCVLSGSASELGDRQALLDSYLGHGTDQGPPDGELESDVSDVAGVKTPSKETA